jgi:hypothetical protein
MSCTDWGTAPEGMGSDENSLIGAVINSRASPSG